jgi:hypothetical protein
MPPNKIFSTASLENTMSRMPKVALPVALLFAALTLSACATKPKEVAAEPVAPVAAAAETAPEPAAVAEQPAPAPVAMTEQTAPKHVVKKAKRKVAKAKVVQPKVIAPEPVATPAPAPEVKQEAPVAATPAPVEVRALPVHKAEPGFLEKYWLWLLGIIIAVIAVVLFKKKS